jgi:hypothetical protein
VKYFSRDVDLATREGRLEWSRRKREYEAHLAAIRGELGSFVRFEEIDFHDAVVRTLRRPSKSTVELALDSGGCFDFEDAASATILFHGVRSVRPESLRAPQAWLYTELHLSASGGRELRVLLTEQSLSIVADEVECRFDRPGEATR